MIWLLVAIFAEWEITQLRSSNHYGDGLCQSVAGPGRVQSSRNDTVFITKYWLPRQSDTASCCR